MTYTIDTIDITDNPAFTEVLAKLRERGKPVALRANGEIVAIVTPLIRPESHPNQDDNEAFRRAAGGWADVDTDRLIHDIYVSRNRSARPSAEQ